MSSFVSTDQFIASIQIDLGFSTESMTPTITRWCYESLLQIGVPKCIIKSKKIKLSDLKIKKPADFVGLKKPQLITLSEGVTGLTGDSGEELTGGCVVPTSVDCISCCDVNDNCHPEFKMSETTHGFYFSNNCTQFTHVLLEYYAAPIDEDNKPMIPLSSSEAVRAYVDFKWLKRRRRKGMGKATASRNNAVGVTDVRDAQSYWEQKRTQAEAAMIEINTQQLKEVGEYLRYDVLNTFPPTLTSCYRSYLSNC